MGFRPKTHLCRCVIVPWCNLPPFIKDFVCKIILGWTIPLNPRLPPNLITLYVLPRGPMCERSRQTLPCNGAEQPSDPGFVTRNKSRSEYDPSVVLVHFSMDERPKTLGKLLRYIRKNRHAFIWVSERPHIKAEVIGGRLPINRLNDSNS